ncbi:hypothetical protein HK098_005705 [Nowakowskiella sp. JEL0407]|nr:hypothetical protein HK098_005705 [Nowakowskiella sp. JEL0407]
MFVRKQQVPPFLLPRYIQEKKDFCSYSLSPADCDNWTVGDVLKLESAALSSLQNLSLGYNDSSGSAEVRRLLASTYLKLNSEQILLHAGSGEVIHNFAQSVMSMGDHVIVQWPCYQSLYQCFVQRGCIVQLWCPSKISIPTKKSSRELWDFDLGLLQKLLKSVPRVSGSHCNVAIIINDPHNPTGFGFTREKMFDLVDICKAHDAYLFSDELYRDLYFEKIDSSDSAPPAVCDMYEKGISVGSMSKQFGMGGIRIGWCATSNQYVLNQMKLYKDYGSFSVSALSELIAIIALRHRLSITKSNSRIIVENLQKATNFFTAYNDIFEFIPMRAGPLALCRIQPTAHEAIHATAKRFKIDENTSTVITRSASSQSLASLSNQQQQDGVSSKSVTETFCDLCLALEGLLVVPMSTMRFVPVRTSRIGSTGSLAGGGEKVVVDKFAWISEWFRVGIARKNFGETLLVLGKIADEIRKSHE